jgi:hypothetical protein
MIYKTKCRCSNCSCRLRENFSLNSAIIDLTIISQIIHEYGKWKKSEKSIPSAILSTASPTWTNSDANPALGDIKN